MAAFFPALVAAAESVERMVAGEGCQLQIVMAREREGVMGQVVWSM